MPGRRPGSPGSCGFGTRAPPATPLQGPGLALRAIRGCKGGERGGAVGRGFRLRADSRRRISRLACVDPRLRGDDVGVGCDPSTPIPVMSFQLSSALPRPTPPLQRHPGACPRGPARRACDGIGPSPTLDPGNKCRDDVGGAVGWWTAGMTSRVSRPSPPTPVMPAKAGIHATLNEARRFRFLQRHPGACPRGPARCERDGLGPSPTLDPGHKSRGRGGELARACRRHRGLVPPPILCLPG